MKKKLSARDRYRQIKAAQDAADLNKPVDDKTPLFDFTAPSGMEFVLRRPDKSMFLTMGALPTMFASKIKAGDKNAAAEMFMSLPATKQIAMIEQSAMMVRFMCVDPKIVDEPTADNEIAPDDITLEDFNAMMEWAQNGGGEAARLSNFRPKR